LNGGGIRKSAVQRAIVVMSLVVIVSNNSATLIISCMIGGDRSWTMSASTPLFSDSGLSQLKGPALEIPEKFRGKTLWEIRRMGLEEEYRALLKSLYAPPPEGAGWSKKMIEKVFEISSAWDHLNRLNILKQVRKPFIHVPSYSRLGDKFAVYEANIAGTRMRVYQIKPFPELAYILGFALADGGVATTYVGDRKLATKLILCQALKTGLEEPLRRKAEKVVNEFQRQHTEALGYPYPLEPTRKEHVSTVYRKRDPKDPKRTLIVPREEAEYFYLYINISPIARLIVNPEGELRLETLSYLAKDPELLGELLAGLWDGDGVVRAKDTDIEFSQVKKNELIVRFVANELLKHGIPISTREAVRDEYYADTLFVKQSGTKEIIIRVLKDGWSKWYELVGRRLQHPEKAEAAREIGRRAPWISAK